MWISVSVEKPRDLQEVLIFDEKRGIQIGHYYQSINSFISKADNSRFKIVRFWMPIPPLPGMGELNARESS